MSGVYLRADRGMWESLGEHLLADGVEQVAFLLADFPNDAPRELRLREMVLVAPEDFSYQGPFHVSLGDDVRPRMIKWAWDRESCLIEAHSHLEGPAAFSPTDLAGLEEFVPHMWWRLQRPYAALVLTTASFDGLAWIEGPHAPVGIAGIRIDGARRVVASTGLSARAIGREAIPGA